MARIATTPAQVERVRREGAALARAAHPGVPHLVEQGKHGDDGWCVIEEHVEGAPLGKVLKVARLPPPRAIGWARQIAAAAAHLHSVGVIHGDLHPDNVIVARDPNGRDRLVLAGFGAARAGDDGPDAPIGSPQVVAPERVRGETCAPAVDIYAIGALLYRMVVDRWPFGGPDAASVLDAHVNRAPARFGEEVPDLRLPPGLEAIARRCLEKQPVDRFASADEVVEALGAVEYAPHRDWVRADGGTLSPVAPREQVPEPVPAPAPRWVIPALLVAFLVLGLWWVWVLV